MVKKKIDVNYLCSLTEQMNSSVNARSYAYVPLLRVDAAAAWQRNTH